MTSEGHPLQIYFSHLLSVRKGIASMFDDSRERAVLRRIGYMYIVVLLNRDECNINVVDTIARSLRYE